MGVLVAGGVLGVAIATLLKAKPTVAAPSDEKLDYLMELQMAQVEQLQRLIEISEGYVPVGMEPLLRPVVGVEPRILIEFMEILSDLGRTRRFDFSITIAVPAGLTTQFALRLPANTVSITRTPLLITSDFYDPLLTVEVWVDESRNPITFGPLPISGPRAIHMDFTVKKFGMDFQFVNGTIFNAVITLESTLFWIETSYFDEFYFPLVQKVFRTVSNLNDSL